MDRSTESWFGRRMSAQRGERLPWTSRVPDGRRCDICNAPVPSVHTDRRCPTRLLWIATKAGDVSQIRNHVADGALVNTVNRHGYTALHHAAFGGHASAVLALIELGARTDMQNRHGETPATTARKAGHNALATALGDASRQVSKSSKAAVTGAGGR